MDRAIGRDPEVFYDPDHFRPERWIDEKGNLREDLRFFNWGFGRRSVGCMLFSEKDHLTHFWISRICPGLHLAQRFAWRASV